jgi:hypothetical protein
MQDICQESPDISVTRKLCELISDVENIENGVLNWENFNDIATKIIAQFSAISNGPSEDIHGLSNLALLCQSDNSALNNSVFEVKRREIIKMDKAGKYIPICTRRVFLKYYNEKPSSEQQYFWSLNDRENYLGEIRNVLINYLPKQESMGV